MADGHREREQRERDEVSHVDAVGPRHAEDGRAVPRLPPNDRIGGAEQEHDAGSHL